MSTPNSVVMRNYEVLHRDKAKALREEEAKAEKREELARLRREMTTAKLNKEQMNAWYYHMGALFYELYEAVMFVADKEPNLTYEQLQAQVRGLETLAREIQQKEDVPYDIRRAAAPESDADTL